MTGGWIRVATVMCDGAEAGPTGFAVLTIQLRKILRVVMDHDLHAVFAKQPLSFNLKHGFSRVDIVDAIEPRDRRECRALELRTEIGLTICAPSHVPWVGDVTWSQFFSFFTNQGPNRAT